MTNPDNFYPLLITGLIIIAIAGVLHYHGYITALRAWFNALPAQTKADLILVAVIVPGLAAWSFT